MNWLVRVGPVALLSAALCFALPANAQVDAGSGQTKDVSGQTINSVGTALYAHDGGQIFNMPGAGNEVTVSTSGGAAHAAYTLNGGIIDLQGGSILTTGSGAFGIVAAGFGAQGQITSVADVTTQGDSSAGVVANDGIVVLNGGTVTTTGANAAGLYVTAPTVARPAQLTSVADVSTSGNGSYGAYVDNGTITLNGGSITTGADGTGGAGAHGLYAVGAFASSTINSVANVTTNGANAYGAYAQNGGVINLTGGSVTTHGAGAVGLWAYNSTITSSADVTTTGDNAGAVVAGDGLSAIGTVHLTGGTITTTGSGSHGLYVIRQGSTMTVDNVTVNVSGPSALGIGFNDATSLSVANSVITSTYNAFEGGANGGPTRNISFTSSTLTSTAGYGMNITTVANGTVALSLTDSQVTGGNGTAINAPNPSILELTAVGSNIIGDMSSAASATINANLSGGTQWTGASLDVNTVTLTGSTWNVTGDSTIRDTLTNGGAIAFQWGGAFNTLTTTNYVGNGGTINFNTALASDDSPTDQLIINGGTAAGMTGVLVTNVGGPGAETTGNGIPIVLPQGGASIAPGSFQLAKSVAAGPYEYLLFQGTFTGAGTTDEEQTYYLRSSIEGSDGEPIPLYRPDVSIHSVLANMARSQELATLGTFHDRNGDQRLAAGAGNRTAAWGRLFGQMTEQSHSGTVNAHFDGSMGGLQAGVDAMQWVGASGHQDRLGLFAAYARTTGDVRGHTLGTPNRIAGRAELDGTSFGGYWTHLAPTGWYTDAVLMGTRFNGEGRSVVGTEPDVKGYGVTASIEGGYPIPLGGGIRLEPQAQLVYSHINIDDVHDPYSHVAYDTPDALFGRLGFRLSADMLPLPYVLRPYLKANVWQDFTETDTIRFSGVHEIESRHRATTLELGGGVTAQLSQAVGLWVSADYTTDIGGPDERESVRGTAGLRVVW